MAKKVIIVSIIVVWLLVFALILTWWFGLTPTVGRSGIERRLARVLTVDYEFVSSEQKEADYGMRSVTYYTYKDVNGIEFTVKSYKQRQFIYAGDAELWWSNRVNCNYTRMFMAQYENDIMELFGDRLDVDYVFDDYQSLCEISVYNYEQIVETATILAKIYAETPPYPINKEAYDDLFAIDPIGFVVKFCHDHVSALGYFDLRCEGEDVPPNDYFLEIMERYLANAIRRGHITKDDIDMDTLPQRVLEMANSEKSSG